jgi:hypothetical protein
MSLLIIFLVLFKRAARLVWADGPMAWHDIRKSHVGQAWADRSACRAARPGTIIRAGLCRPGQDGPRPGQAGPPVWPSINTANKPQPSEEVQVKVIDLGTGDSSKTTMIEAGLNLK